MRKLREILRLRLYAGLSIRQIRDSLRARSGRIDNWTPHTLIDKLTCIQLVNGVSYEKYYCGR